MSATRIDDSRGEHSWDGWLGWVVLIGAITMAAAAGTRLPRAWGGRHWLDAVVGGLMLLIATLMAIEGVRRQRAARAEQAATDARFPHPSRLGELPRIGEILIYKYHLISEKDVHRALERQTATGQRLGEVLVEMGKLSWPDLAKALEDQFAYNEMWKAK